MSHYIGLVRKEDGTDYGVDFPDFPGCITAGTTLQEAARLAEEALNFHIRGTLEDGDPIPVPSEMDAVMTDPNNAGAMPILVRSFHRPKGRAIRTNITIEENLLAEIDAFAMAHSLTRSAFLANAAQQALTVAR